MSDPHNDPLFIEPKQLSRNTLNTSLLLERDAGARKPSEISNQSTLNNEMSRTPSPRPSPRAD